MKIIHCSDAHLDSAMERNLSPAQARERNAEICATFGRLVKYAAENQVDAVLIAGDLFDTDRVSARTADYVMERIRGAETVEFFYLRGNHDEAADVFAGMELDLTEIVVSNILLNLSYKYLCSEDCKGLCPHCGTDLNLQDCDCDKEYIDPRWEKLAEIMKNMSDTE